jgi:hypothetical protein
MFNSNVMSPNQDIPVFIEINFTGKILVKRYPGIFHRNSFSAILANKIISELIKC